MFELGSMCAGLGMLMTQYSHALVIPGCGLAALGAFCVFEDFRHRSRFDVLFRNLGICVGDVYPMLKRSKEQGPYTLYEFTLPAGLSTDTVVKHQTEIEQYLGHSVQIDYGFKNMLIKVFDGKEKDIMDYEPIRIKGAVPILIGYDRAGNIVTADLGQGEPHMYVAGETGSGKSTALRAILVNLILQSDVELFLGDLKNGVEFNLFKRCSKVKCFARTEEEILSMLKSVGNEVERRYQLLSDSDAEDIRQYNKTHRPLKYQLVVIDEFATLMYEKESTQIVETLAAKARACGIHLLLSTQRPDAKVITGRIKANISNVLGLKTLDGTNSQIIIGHPGLEKLRGKGHGIFKRGSEEVIIQIPYLSVEKARELLAPYNAVKRDEKLPVDHPLECLDRL